MMVSFKNTKKGETTPLVGKAMLPDRVEQPTNLQTPPNLAATGSQEIKPVLTVPLRATSDALTGIKRADTANEKP
jgi:hypothetical protein